MTTIRPYRSARTVGRTRIRLAKLLEEQGYAVAPEDLLPQQGAWRTGICLDVCRWEAVVKDKTGRTWIIHCWDRMTDCVRYGITTEPDERNRSYLEVNAKPPPSKE